MSFDSTELCFNPLLRYEQSLEPIRLYERSRDTSVYKNTKVEFRPIRNQIDSLSLNCIVMLR